MIDTELRADGRVRRRRLQNERAFDIIAGVPTNYARTATHPYGTEGARRTFYCTHAFYALLETCFNELWRECPLGVARTIVSAGAYVSPEVRTSTMHNAGRAIDIDSLWWPTRNIVANTYPNNQRFYLGVEGIYHRHFVHVLDYNYNVDHRDHWHVDNTMAPAFDQNSSARVNYLQASLRYIHLRTEVVVDGAYGSITENATRQVLANLGITGYITTASVWLEYLLRTARLGMA